MNRPRAVDFLDEKEVEVSASSGDKSGNEKEYSDEEPLIVEQDEQEHTEELVEQEEDKSSHEEQPAETLPSGAISKGNHLHLLQESFLYFYLCR